MTGGLIHLAYTGSQEKYLTNLPQITFFKTMYCRHGHFAIEDHYIQSSSDAQFGKSTYFKIRDYGDLAFRPYMKITLPTIEAQYIESLDYYIDKYYNVKHVSNVNANNVITKLNAMVHNYDGTSIPIIINENTMVLYNYENLINGVSSIKIKILDSELREINTQENYSFDLKFIFGDTKLKETDINTITNKIDLVGKNY